MGVNKFKPSSCALSASSSQLSTGVGLVGLGSEAVDGASFVGLEPDEQNRIEVRYNRSAQTVKIIPVTVKKYYDEG